MTTIGSLFTGYGGLDMGVAMALDPAARVAWTSDVEPGPCKLAATRRPDIPNLGDITKIDWADVEPVDIICGGSPCQDLSLAGKRAGMHTGTRSGLWESMAAAVETIRPRLARWEHVTGRQAPPPTNPPRREGGKPQLSARFVEWLMGLPDGHVTGPDLNLSRERQLRMLGNGVVPQQAALAVNTLINTAKDVENDQF